MTAAAPALFVDSSGALVPVAPEEAAGAAKLGWVQASDQQAKDYALQQKYGTTGQQAITGLEGVARGLTLGLSTPVETALGVDPQGIAGREKANPTLSAATEGAGIAGGLLVPGLAEVSGPSIAARAGGATTRAVARTASSTAGRILSSGAAAAAGSAVEGAFYGAGRVVHEAALGDPAVVAQSALASVGTTALLFGALGGGGSLVAKGLGAAAEKAAPWLSDALESVEAHANLQAAGGDKGTARRMVEKFGPEGARARMLELRDVGVIDSALTTPHAALENAQRIIKEQGAKIGAMLDTASAEGKIDAAPLVRQALDEGMGVAAKLAGNPFQAGAGERIAEILGTYEEKLSAGATVRDLHTMEREFGQEVYGLKGTRDPRANPAIEALNKIRRRLSAVVDQGVADAGVPEKEWAQANRAFSVAKDGERMAQNGVARLEGNNPLSLTGTLGAMAGLAHAGPAGLLAGIPVEAAKRYGSGLTGYFARAARKALGEGAIEAVADKTAEAIAAERRAAAASQPLRVPMDALKAAPLDSVNLAEPRTQGRLAAIAKAKPEDLPPIRLYRDAQGALRVDDGQHRLYAAQQRGDPTISADMLPGHAPPPGATPIASSATNSEQAVATLALLERMNNAVAAKIDAAASTLVRAGPKAKAVARGEAAAGVASVFGKSNEDATSTFRRQTEQLSNLAQNPELMHQAMVAQTADWHEHAPQVAQAMGLTSATAVAFLASKIPQHPKAGPLAAEWVPSRDEIAKFHRYSEAVEHPLSVLKQAAAGTLTPEGVEALHAVYPDLLGKVQTALVAAMAAHKDVPYRSRLMLSMLLGQDMDGTLNPLSVAHAMAGYMPKQQGPAMPMPKSAKASKSTLPNRMLTPMQATGKE